MIVKCDVDYLIPFVVEQAAVKVNNNWYKRKDKGKRRWCRGTVKNKPLKLSRSKQLLMPGLVLPF